MLVEGVPNAATVPRGPVVDGRAVPADLGPGDHRLAAGQGLVNGGAVHAFASHSGGRSVALGDRQDQRIVDPIAGRRVVVRTIDVPDEVGIWITPLLDDPAAYDGRASIRVFQREELLLRVGVAPVPEAHLQRG